MHSIHVLSSEIEKVVNGCVVLRELGERCTKSNNIHHNERHLLACTFGHMGEEGRAFVHYLLKNAENYSQPITNHYLDTLMKRPMGCEKIGRDLHVTELAEKCKCVFSLRIGQYRSPLLFSDTYSSIVVIDEPNDALQAVAMGNYANEIQEFVSRIFTLNQQIRLLRDEIAICENGLSEIFDEKGIDAFDVLQGTVSRAKINDKWDWSVDI